jgi:hypothetical protein
VLQNLRRPVSLGDQDVRKRFVVAQQHVEARAQALDQVRFEEQRLGLGCCGDELDRRCHRDHAGDARHLPGRPRIGQHALADVLGLADVEYVAACADHAVDARLLRGELGELLDDAAPGADARLLGRRVEARSAVVGQIGKLSLLVVVLQFDFRVEILLLHVRLG